MATDYAFVGVFLVVGALFVVVNVDVISRLIRPSAPNPAKLTTYECGEEPIGGAWLRFHIRYYLFALIYIVFAVEAVFLIPCVVVLNSLGLAEFVALTVFVALLLVGFAYDWKKGGLEWV